MMKHPYSITSGTRYKNRVFSSRTRGLRAARLVALLASLTVIAQTAFILFRGEVFCLNEGCKIVEGLSRVEPLFFNLAGLLFFQGVYWGLGWARRRQEPSPGFTGFILLAAMAMEGLFVAFQYQVAQNFCLYCLAIFGFIVLLNLLLGPRQAIRGLLLFATVFLAFSALSFDQGKGAGRGAFTDGVFALHEDKGEAEEHFLFFSSTCGHCQQVLAALREHADLAVALNPLDRIKQLDLPYMQRRPVYSPEANRMLLAALGIDEIPVLVSRTAGRLSILRGERDILAWIAGRPVAPISGQIPQLSSEAQGQSRAADPLIPGFLPSNNVSGAADDSCRVSSDCTGAPSMAPSTLPSSQPGR